MTNRKFISLLIVSYANFSFFLLFAFLVFWPWVLSVESQQNPYTSHTPRNI